MFVAAILIVVGYFLPWLKNDASSLSGVDLSFSGYPFLMILPGLGILTSLLFLKSPRFRPLPSMMAGATGLLLIFLLVSMILNFDDGVLALQRNEGLGNHLRFHRGEATQVFDNLGHMFFGLYLMLAGCTALFVSPLVRPRQVSRESADVGARQGGPPEVSSLDELRPQWTPRNDFRIGTLCLIGGAILIFTYTWCGISPMRVWENRGNAREYLFGKALTETDLDYIRDQTERAPEIEAQGRARAYQDNKYRGVPFEEQPGLLEKTRENERLVKRFLSEMTEEEKKALQEKAQQSSLDEKRGGYFPPETGWKRVKGYLIALLETVAIAIWGTLLAVLCAVPASLLAARNTLGLMIPGESPWIKAFRRFCIFGIRRFLDACRGFNEFVMALIFVAVIGLGPYAGILALWIHTFGILGKVFSEQIEAIEEGQVEAVTSTGAAVDQTIVFSVLPQVMPAFVSYSLLRFESNVRSAAILGFVGAGGIGFLIFDKLNGYLFREVCTMMIIIIIAVGVIDFFCGKLRQRFI
jgi:phosphonate transport system permease protein